MIDATIPHSIDAEHAVIGAILHRSAAIDEIGQLKPEHFFVEAHREIFRCMLAMSATGHDIDVITLAEAIDGAGKSSVTGGLPYIGQIAANTTGSSVRRYAEVVINKSTERRLLAAVADIQSLVGGCGETREKLSKAQQMIMAIHEAQQERQPRIVKDALSDYVETLERRFGGHVRGTPTGFTAIDSMLSGGLQAGNLVIIAGRPSMGKSAFSNSVAINVAQGGTTAAIFSMEMTETEQVDRVVATLGRVGLQHVLDANLDGEEGQRIYAAIEKLQTLPLVIDDQAGLSVHEVMAKARQIKRKHGLGLMIVDALGLMDYDSSKAVSELGHITKTLKAFAKEVSVPVVLLCQLSRKVEERTDKRPIMSDLRDSGNIEQDADVVMMLYRDEYYRPDSADKGIAEVLIRKNRQGKCGTVPLYFIADQTRFENFDGEWQRQQPAKRIQSGGFN